MGRLLEAEPYKAPVDDAELCARYQDYARKLLISNGVAPQHAEDATQEVLTHLIRRNVRGMYKPEHTAAHGGKQVRCSFRTFLSAQVILYARGIREKNTKQASRELFLLDEPDDSGHTWAEALAGTWAEDYTELGDGELVTRMRAWLALQPPASPASPDLLALFDGLAEESRSGTPLEMTPSKRAAGVQQLRDALAGTRAADPPAASWDIGGVTLAPVDVRAAIAVLEAAKGIMVAGPLERAGHPLAQAAKGWYHPFSKEERALFPELEIDPNTHKKPAGHVKLAVLHRLRRMLTEVLDGSPASQPSDQVKPDPAPAFPQAVLIDAPSPEPASPWDQIEATLWRLGGGLADVDACRQWAEQGGMVLA